MTVTGERIDGKEDAAAIAAACDGSAVSVQTVERREKSERPPALYDLTTLQRDANRTLGYTAQQTLDYLQALYEKKLCIYPRTDSRYLTDDMEGTVSALVAAAAVICEVDAPEAALSSQVCSSGKVTDHIMPLYPPGAPLVRTLPTFPWGSGRSCGWWRWGCSGRSARPIGTPTPPKHFTEDVSYKGWFRKAARI